MLRNFRGAQKKCERFVPVLVALVLPGVLIYNIISVPSVSLYTRTRKVQEVKNGKIYPHFMLVKGNKCYHLLDDWYELSIYTAAKRLQALRPEETSACCAKRLATTRPRGQPRAKT